MSTNMAGPVAVTQCDLFLARGDVLSISLDPDGKNFPPTEAHCASIQEMIEGLARAARAVVYHAENDTATDACYAMQPVESIADAIVMLSRLSEAVRLSAKRKD